MTKTPITFPRDPNKKYPEYTQAYFMVPCVQCGVIRSVNRKGIGGKCRACAGKDRRVTDPNESHRHYRRWCSMRSRCASPNHHAYESYGGRGVSVCSQWSDFKTFALWCDKSGFEEGLSLDRIDNDGPYSPENCKWSTSKAQSANRRPMPKRPNMQVRERDPATGRFMKRE